MTRKRVQVGPRSDLFTLATRVRELDENQLASISFKLVSITFQRLKRVSNVLVKETFPRVFVNRF